MKSSRSGQTLIEIIIAIAIFSVVVSLAIFSVANVSSSTVRSRLRSQATNYAKEGIEICYNLSLQDWIEFSDKSGTYHPVLSSGVFILAQGSQLLADRFTREITIEDANDPDVADLLKVTSLVTWYASGRDQEVKFVIYLADLEGLII